MTTVNILNTVKNAIFNEPQNDVVPIKQSTMVTDTPCIGHGQSMNCENNNEDDMGDILATVSNSESVNDCSGVSALSLNDKDAKVAVIVTGHQSSIKDECKIGKIKRRRRKTKTKSSSGIPKKKFNWILRAGRYNGVATNRTNQAPYNTNKFLMEEHMPEIRKHRRHDRSSGGSGDGPGSGNGDPGSRHSRDSDDNVFALMSEDEEFLSKEFSSAYEDVRSERLDGMSRTQLIHEYMQLEANYDKLSKNLVDRSIQQTHVENHKLIKQLEERVKELTAENLELRREMADIRNRRRRRRSHSTNKRTTNSNRHKQNNRKCADCKNDNSINTNDATVNNNSSSEDSESDSSTTTTSSTSSSSSSSNNSSGSNSSRSTKSNRSARNAPPSSSSSNGNAFSHLTSVTIQQNNTTILLQNEDHKLNIIPNLNPI